MLVRELAEFAIATKCDPPQSLHSAPCGVRTGVNGCGTNHFCSRYSRGGFFSWGYTYVTYQQVFAGAKTRKKSRFYFSYHHNTPLFRPYRGVLYVQGRLYNVQTKDEADTRQVEQTNQFL